MFGTCEVKQNCTNAFSGTRHRRMKKKSGLCCSIHLIYWLVVASFLSASLYLIYLEISKYELHQDF